MKRIVVLALLSFTIITSCSILETTSQIQIKNSIQNFQFLYGLRIGDAEYNGALGPNQTTPYYEIDKGDYYVEAKTNTGVWIDISESEKTISAGKKYTLEICGTYDTESGIIEDAEFKLSD